MTSDVLLEFDSTVIDAAELFENRIGGRFAGLRTDQDVCAACTNFCC